MITERILGIPYDRLADPRDINALAQPPSETNCRRLVQQFFFDCFGLALPPDHVLSAESYHHTGIIVADPPIDLSHPDGLLQFGHVIFAKPHQPSPHVEQLPSEALLHMAIFLGKPTDEKVLAHFPSAQSFDPRDTLILHATSRNKTGKSALWTASEFLSHYTPVRVKDFLS